MTATRIIINKSVAVVFWSKTSKKEGKEVEVKWRKETKKIAIIHGWLQLR